jgi:hypothetical protein
MLTWFPPPILSQIINQDSCHQSKSTKALNRYHFSFETGGMSCLCSSRQQPPPKKTATIVTEARAISDGAMAFSSESLPRPDPGVKIVASGKRVKTRV